ncbi:MAG: signal recognition particle protein [Mollicutes bacterium PWAP]|nr:signal recognition particle protein [Mollicutes bacterium PWAP]
MLNFLGNKLQKSIKKMKSKTNLEEADILEITREIKLSLLEADVNLMVVKSFIKNVKEKAIGSSLVGKLDHSQTMIKIVQDELTKILGGKEKPIVINKKPFIIMMVGLQGSGKTTTTAKIAKFLQKKKQIKKPLLVAADVYRPAAIAQLKTLAKSLQFDVFAKTTEDDPRDIVVESIKFAEQNDNDLILIDTAGRLSIDENLMKELIDIKKLITPDEIFFVADAMSGQDIINVATEFNKNLNLNGSVITKLDSDARGGAALSISQLLNLPIRFIGTGEKVSQIDFFYPERMAKRILGMGDVLTLIEKLEDLEIDENANKKMMRRMASGQFDLNDLMNQLSQIKKMGKMSGIMKLIPGLKGKVDKDKMERSEKRFELFTLMINSMTDFEKKNPKVLKQSDRKKRIINGSGRSAQEYNLLISEFDRLHKQMKETAKKIEKGDFDPRMMGMI